MTPKAHYVEEVKSCNGVKAVGPDVYNLHFFQRCWSIVKEDVWTTMDFFF